MGAKKKRPRGWKSFGESTGGWLALLSWTASVTAGLMFGYTVGGIGGAVAGLAGGFALGCGLLWVVFQVQRRWPIALAAFGVLALASGVIGFVWAMWGERLPTPDFVPRP
jgi:hypothetical protein